MNDMIPFVTGWLLGAVEAHGHECMKIEEVQALSRDKLSISFASGLVLEVTVREAQAEDPLA